MSSENFQESLSLVLGFEGGYSNDPDDHGGSTMCGIIQREYDVWRKEHGLNVEPVRNILDTERDAIYQKSYWNIVHADELPSGLELCVFDYAVNSGPARAIKTLQQIVGVPMTGVMSTNCLDALTGYTVPDIIARFQKSRTEFLKRIGVGSQKKFLRGWLSRVEKITEAANYMVTMIREKPQLSNGARGSLVRELQTRLSACGYPVGVVDGVYGGQVRRAVILWQHEMAFETDAPGVWKAEYWTHLNDTRTLNRERAGASVTELLASGNRQMTLLHMLQRLLAFIGLGGIGVGTFPETLTAIKSVIDPVSTAIDWMNGRPWVIVTTVSVMMIVIVRLLITDYLETYRRNGVQ